MATLATDTFTDTAGTVLSSHVAADGTTWAAHPSSAQPVLISTGGRAYQSVVGVSIYNMSNVALGSADYDVVADFVKLSAAGTRMGIAGRCNSTTNDMYCAFYNVGGSQWELYRVNSSVLTGIGTPFAQALTISQAYNVTLRMVGTAITLLVDGVSRVTATDATVTAIGRGAIRGQNGNGTDTTGIHLDNFTINGVAQVDVAPDGTSGWPRYQGSVLLSTATGTQSVGGFLRDPSGDIAVTVSTVGASWQSGFLRGPAPAGQGLGPLVVNTGGSGSYIGGFLRDATYALVVVTSGSFAMQGGFMRDATGRLSATINSA